jgi:hypothetical protein
MSRRWAWESVERCYDVPAYYGRRVTLHIYGAPLRGKLISCTGSHLFMRTDGGQRIGPLHPCWKIDYHDGRGDRTRQPTPLDRAWA